MASEADLSVYALIERLIATPLFATARSESDSSYDSSIPDHESTNSQSLDRIILINPLTQGMMVIGGSAADFDSVLNDLMSKEGQPPASQASIDDMPVLEVKGREEIESLGGECAICLEEWVVGDVVKEMPCNHKFHGGCVERWLKIHGSCPLCRHKMPVVDDLDKKIEDGNGRRRRREIWVTLTFGDGRRTIDEQSSDEESSAESHES